MLNIENNYVLIFLSIIISYCILLCLSIGYTVLKKNVFHSPFLISYFFIITLNALATLIEWLIEIPPEKLFDMPFNALRVIIVIVVPYLIYKANKKATM